MDKFPTSEKEPASVRTACERVRAFVAKFPYHKIYIGRRILPAPRRPLPEDEKEVYYNMTTLQIPTDRIE